MLDANEKDPQAGLACRCVAGFLGGVDLMSADLATLIARIDREILPEAAREWRIPGLSSSLLIARLSGEVVTIGHVGEARVRLLDAAGGTLHVTREDNIYGSYPESVWRDKYSEDDAKQTILAVVGGGTATAHVAEVPQPPQGALFASSHLWHRHAVSEIPSTWDLKTMEKLPPVSDGQAIALLHW
jgi:hypothetical protein